MKVPLPLLVVAALAVPPLAFGSDIPAEAAKLKEIHQREINKLNVAYLQRLDALLADYRTKGDDKAVAAIEKLVAEVESEKARSEPATPTNANDEVLLKLVGVWKRDTDGGVWKIENTKGGVFNGKLRFTMTYDAATGRVLVVGDSWADHLTFTSNPDVVNGATEVRGKKQRYKLKRVE